MWAGLGGIEELEELDELTAAVAILDQGVNLAGQQVDSGQQAHRPMTLAFMVAREGRVNVRLGGKSGERRPIAWIAGFSSQEIIATASLGFFCEATATFFKSFTLR